MPGASYTVDAPVLWFAREAALAAGLNILAVVDGGQTAADPTAFVQERADAALEAVADPSPLLIGKSVSTLAAGIAAERALVSVWLTPLLNAGQSRVARRVVAAMQRSMAPALLVGGSADSAWSPTVARSIPLAEVLEIDGADHALQVPGDPLASIAALRALVERLMAFIQTAHPEPRAR